MARRGSNEGSVYRRKDGRWCAAMRVPGRRRPVVRYTRTQALAIEAMSGLRRAARAHALPSKRPTIREALSAWLESQSALVRPRTLDSYRAIAERYILPTLGSVHVDALTPAHVQQLMAAKRRSGLSPRTVNMIRGTLRQALRQTQQWGFVERNVAALTRAMPGERREPTVWAPGTAQAFLEAVRGDRLAALWHLAVYTGMRRGETVGRQWSDLDLDAGTLRVQRSLGRVKGQGLVSLRPKTDAGRRTLALGLPLVSALKAHRNRQLEERMQAGPAWQDTGYVFTTEIGTPTDPDALTRAFQRIVAKAGLPRIRLHDLRHGVGSYLASAGASPVDVAAQLGHASAGFTMSTYAHAFDTTRERTAAMLTATLDGGATETS